MKLKKADLFSVIRCYTCNIQKPESRISESVAAAVFIRSRYTAAVAFRQMESRTSDMPNFYIFEARLLEMKNSRKGESDSPIMTALVSALTC